MYTEYRPRPLSAFRFGLLFLPSTNTRSRFRLDSEDYYGHYVFPGSIKVPERPLSYHTQFDWNRRTFQGVGIQSKEKTIALVNRASDTWNSVVFRNHRFDAPGAGIRTL